MKKKYIGYTLFFLIIFSFQSYSQEYEIGEKKVVAIFEIEGKNKSQLFSIINKWISINYNSAKNVIQMNDKESGTIIVKGINKVSYKTSLTFENPSFFPKTFFLSFRHLIEINIKDNRFRVIYKVIDVDESYCRYSKKWSFYVYKDRYKAASKKCINLKDVDEKCVNEYNEALEEYLDNIWTGKKNKRLMFSATKLIFDEMNENIKSDIYVTLKSIENSVYEENKDDW